MFLKDQEEMRGGREAAVKILQHSVGMREAADCHFTCAEKRKEGSCALEEEAEGGTRRETFAGRGGFFFSCGETPMTHQEMKTADVMRKKKEA